MQELAYILIGLILGFAAGFGLRSFLLKRSSNTLAKKTGDKIAEAQREASSIIREAEIAAKSEVIKAREAFEASTRDQRRQITDSMAALNKREETIAYREDNLDRKADVLDRKETTLENKQNSLETSAAELAERETSVAKTKAEAETRLARLAGMTRDEVRKDLFEQTKTEIQSEMGIFVRREKELAEESAARDAQHILLTAMQRYSGSHAADTMARNVPVPGEDAKGKLIGREGRNIRALEAATGVNIIIDDTPESVIVSGFDPIRREIAAMTIDSLLKSGRIQPGRIEEVVAQIQSGMEETIREIGAQAAGDTNTPIVSGKTLRQLGRLKFRNSFTQNVLQHSIEVACISSALAAEIGLDPAIAKKAGLLHDIGKSLDHEIDGPHASIGAHFLTSCGEDQAVIDAVAGHHGEIENITLYAVLVSTADAISSSRPGARSETAHIYVNRIEKLEEMALSFDGVLKCHAVQSGRDLRVIVDPRKISDNDAILLARDLCLRIQNELQYPGKVRVTVIRETRCIEYAH